ncbi:putative NAD-dependent protein-ADP-ribosyltransferase YbiA (DUF1768 family) [Bradyrhizobium sp. LM3.6]
MIALAMGGRRKTNHGCADAGQRQRSRFRHAWKAVRGLVVLGRKAAGGEQRDAGGDDKRTVRAVELLADRQDRAAVELAIVQKLREVVVEAEVQDAVRGSGAAAQGRMVLQRPAMDLGAHRGEGGCAGVAAGKAGNAMAGGDQVPNDGGADEAGGAGDENTHG